MKKIMFDDHFGLTDAVLELRKNMTRRFAEKVLVEDDNGELHWNGEFKKPRYKVGEVVAVAQRYSDIMDESVRNNYIPKWSFADEHCDEAGWKNKMFVRADLMPHQIRITSVRNERIQDISDEDCLREGIYEVPFCEYAWEDNGKTFKTAREAFAALIDKISGRGTWAENPWVFVYEFELVK